MLVLVLVLVIVIVIVIEFRRFMVLMRVLPWSSHLSMNHSILRGFVRDPDIGCRGTTSGEGRPTRSSFGLLRNSCCKGLSGNFRLGGPRRFSVASVLKKRGRQTGNPVWHATVGRGALPFLFHTEATEVFGE